MLQQQCHRIEPSICRAASIRDSMPCCWVQNIVLTHSMFMCVQAEMDAVSAELQHTQQELGKTELALDR